MSVPHFRIPLNLPHAATIAARIHFHLSEGPDAPKALELAGRLVALLAPYRMEDENPATDVADRVVTEGAAFARSIVTEIEQLKIGHDRLGQAVRNLFECFELGEEGATISLRAGENPNSALRPL